MVDDIQMGIDVRTVCMSNSQWEWRLCKSNLLAHHHFTNSLLSYCDFNNSGLKTSD